MANSVAEALSLEKQRAAAIPQASYEPPPEEAPKRQSILEPVKKITKLVLKYDPLTGLTQKAIGGITGNKNWNFMDNATGGLGRSAQDRPVYNANAFETQLGRPGQGSNPLFDKYKSMV